MQRRKQLEDFLKELEMTEVKTVSAQKDIHNKYQMQSRQQAIHNLPNQMS